MKILLINPSDDNILQAELPSFVREEVGVFPPLGLMYIASYLRRHCPEHTVAVLDSLAKGMTRYEVKAFLSDYGPDVVGVSTHTQNLIDILFLIQDIKEINPKIHLTLGGAHVNAFPEESIGINGVDSVVLGEGEVAFSELVGYLSTKDDLRKVKGIIYKDAGKAVRTNAREVETDLDKYPFPERQAFGKDPYHYVLSNAGGKIGTLISSRGCTFRCNFCSTPHEGYRMRSPQDIVNEMEECVGQGIDEIHFVDDNFGFDAEKTLFFCEEIRKRGLKVKWGARARADRLNKTLIREFKESGCYRINLGVETSTDEGLQLLNKGISVAQIRDVFFWLKEAGIGTVAYFMLGCPHEKTKKDILRTVEFAKELDPDYAMFNLLTLYPGTALYEQGIRKGVMRGDRWEFFVSSPRRDFKIPIWGEHFSREELAGFVREAYQRFYLRPRFICRSLKNVSRNPRLAKRIGTGLRILCAR